MIEEIYRKAVKIDASVINLADVSKLTKEAYIEICRLASEGK
jgi:DeoR/GlpR family transcriptional regulator of sugar metabolism